MFWLQFLTIFRDLVSLWLLDLIKIKIMLRILISIKHIRKSFAQIYEHPEDGQELKPKHVGEIINKITVRRVGIECLYPQE